MADLFVTTDVWGNEVHLTEERWKNHILSRHPEITPYGSEVQNCVEQPTCVYASASNANRQVFYQLGSGIGRYIFLYLRVVVDYSREPAWVVTAHFASDLSAGGTLLWLQPRL